LLLAVPNVKLVYLLSRLGLKTCLSMTKTKILGQRPRPTISGFKTKTKTLMFETMTKTQNLQDQYWKVHDWDGL